MPVLVKYSATYGDLLFYLLYVKSFKSKNSVGRKCFQLKVLKVLLMHLFVTLLINKTTGSNNRHFFFNTLEKENKEEFLTYSTFCTLEQIEKNILRKRLSQDALSKVHLNKYGSYFKFILLLSGDINLNSGPTAPKRNDILWEFLPFQNCSFSPERMDYQLDPLSVVSNGVWNIFQKRGMHFILLIFSFSFNNKLLNKIVTGVLFTGEICYNQLNIIIGGEVLFNINKSISTCTDTGIGTLVIGKTYTCK